MEPVDVLCYNRREMSAPLELREGVVPRVRRSIEIDEAPPIEVEELSVSLYIPPALRKSGIPDSVDTPAPPKKTARRLALRIALSVSISVIVNLLA